jgi:hypothetical protein
MDVFGVPINIWHGLVVEEHTGIAVFVILTLVVRILTDIIYRKPNSPSWVQTIKQGSDFIGYAGSAAIVFFLILSGVTGYLIQPYSTLIASPVLINKSLLALAAVFFWLAYFLVRFRCGPGLWSKKGLYAVEVIAAFLGIMFTALTASMGAELTVGQSAMEPVYNALNFSWNTFLVNPVDIEVTVGIVVIGVLIMFLFPSRLRKPN